MPFKYPWVPTYVVALIVSQGNKKGYEIADLHASLLMCAEKAGIPVLSIGSQQPPKYWACIIWLPKLRRISNFDWSNVNIHITIPLRGRLKRLLVTVPNTKHAWKTAADQILSGAGLITFGKYYLSIGYLAKIVQTPNSSPYQKAGSIINQQDNRCAQQKMNGNTMEI